MPRDLLDDLRAANPVDRDRLAVPATLAARVLDADRPAVPALPSRRWPRIAFVAVAGAAAIALVAVLVLGRGAAPGLLDRAYAAAGGGGAKGIAHWRIDRASYRGDGRVASRQRTEGWKRGATMHVLHYDVVHGKPHVTADIRTVGHRSRAWMSVSDDYTSATLRKPRSMNSEDVIFRDGDPLVAFRAAYRSGRLHDLGGGRFDVRFKHMPPGSVVYEVDRRTGQPLRRVAQLGGKGREVTTFSTYETLPDTPDERAKLALLAHPGAGPGAERAADVFRALREGPVPTGADRVALRRMAHSLDAGHRYHLDLDGIRAVIADVWLIPGRGYVCLAHQVGGRLGGIGGTCLTVRKATRQGIETGQPHETLVVVPDGVVAVEARRGWHGPWKRYPASGGVVRLPGLSYQVRLAR